MAKSKNDVSMRFAALAAGISILIMTFAAPFALISLQNLIVAGDAALTASNILGSSLMFRLAIVGFFITIVCDVVSAWGLYIVLKSVNRGLSLLTACFRLVHAIIFGIGLIFLFAILPILNNPAYLSSFELSHVQSMVLFFYNLFNYGFLLGLLFFSLHVLILGYLVFKSKFIPKWIGFLLMIGGPFGYLIDSTSQLLLLNSGVIAYPGLAVATIGEVSLFIWLLAKGGKK
jgi:hypothetical protein